MDNQEFRQSGSYVVIAYKYGHRDGHSYLVDLCVGIDTAKEAAQKEYEDRGGKYSMVVFAKTKEGGKFIEEVYKIDCPEKYTAGTVSAEQAAEEMYPSGIESCYTKRTSFREGWDAALSTQSPKWVKASERLQDPEVSPYMICRYNGLGAKNERYRFVITFQPGAVNWGFKDEDMIGLEWLDESPSSAHPLQEKIDGLREALEEIVEPIKKMSSRLKDDEKLNGIYAVQLSNDANYLKSIAQKALETYK